MLRRKIINDLVEWKNNKSTKKKALVIKGLRQVGKTYSVRQFAKENYEYECYINFKNDDDLKSVFDLNLNVNRILFDLSAKRPHFKFVQNKTLIIFDEIQECSNARASLKAFVEDGRFDVIATGSMLGIQGYNQKHSKGVPTGSEHIIHMKPLDFEEFLWAKNVSTETIDYLKDCFKNQQKISQAVHESMLRYFKEYICVGGLPEAVNTFISTNNMQMVHQELQDILTEYADDFGKHLDKDENEYVDKILLLRIREVFNSIPNQLAKENKKFQFSKLKKNGRSSQYFEAIQWLVDAGLVLQCFNLSNLELPLEGNKISDSFKLYFQDSGLFIAMLDEGTTGDILSNKMSIYKGAIYENIVADAFAKMNRKLYYFSKTSGLEIDFVVRYENNLSIIEVKSKTGNSKSAKTVMENKAKYHVDQLIKIGEYNIGKQKNILTIPYYLTFLLN